MLREDQKTPGEHAGGDEQSATSAPLGEAPCQLNICSNAPGSTYCALCIGPRRFS